MTAKFTLVMQKPTAGDTQPPPGHLLVQLNTFILPHTHGDTHRDTYAFVEHQI